MRCAQRSVWHDFVIVVAYLHPHSLPRLDMLSIPHSSFWARVGLQQEDELRCIEKVQERYNGCQVQHFREQGYCSFTLLVSLPDNISTISDRDEHSDMETAFDHDKTKSLIVQIRSAQHALDLRIAQAAKETYHSLVPLIRYLNLKLPGQLCAYEMQKMRGTPVSRLLPGDQLPCAVLQKKQERLVGSFAALIAHGWQSSLEQQSRCRYTRADSPMEDVVGLLSQCTGKVGSSIIPRLQKLSEELYDIRWRQKAKSVLTRVKTMDTYPVILNHGDLIPSNILIDENTWEITGLVDWAEAEYLPFGTCLYGLEHMLGYITSTSLPSPQLEDNSLNSGDKPTFVYYNNAAHLRDMFWNHLFKAVPDIKMRQEDVRMMRDMGVLLWYGYAWDDGAIDRVVNEKDDVVEVTCLRTFLEAT
jgi:hypothetical protein